MKHVPPVSWPTGGGGRTHVVFLVEGPLVPPSAGLDSCQGKSILHCRSDTLLRKSARHRRPLTRSSTAVTPLYLCADNKDGVKEMMEGEGTELQG